MNNLDKKLQKLAKSRNGKIFKAAIKRLKAKARDVNEELPINTDNEIDVRKAIVRLIEQEIENKMINKETEDKSTTSYE